MPASLWNGSASRRPMAAAHCGFASDFERIILEIRSMTPARSGAPMPKYRTKLSTDQIVGFWAAWSGWTLDGMDSFIYALVMAPALTELLPNSGIAATPANVT